MADRFSSSRSWPDPGSGSGSCVGSWFWSSPAGCCIGGRLTATLADVAKNVLGGELETCSVAPVTGWLRDGCCNTGTGDLGVHTVCAVMTDEFLDFSRSVGNDLSTPRPEFGFEGLTAGDRWCVCASRWTEALDAGLAPPVVLEATHVVTLEWTTLADLEEHAVSRPS